MYTKDTLNEINYRYTADHMLSDHDVDKVNAMVERIEESRDVTCPKPGDRVRLTNKFSEYFHCAHIEHVDQNGDANICESPYVPFVDAVDNGIACSTSGGAWGYYPIEKLKYVGKERKEFCAWGWCGPCANGSVHFFAEVCVWEYVEEGLLFGDFTTKDWDRDFVSFNEDGTDFGYHYLGHGHAYRTEDEYLAWLLTYKGVEFEGNWPNQTVVWTYRIEKRFVSREQWDALTLPTDTRMMNGSIIPIKYQYDDGAHIIYEFRYANSGSEGGPPYRVAMANVKSGQRQRSIRKQNI